MKFSKMFLPTTKEVPKDATLPSHKFLLKGAFISQLGSGIYNFMPLGKIVLNKITKIVKEEMDNSGSNEVQFGFVTPTSFWEESGRASTMGKELLKFDDRKNTSYLLSPTNEESAVDLIRNKVNSYKELPISLYHINLKFRDEARPRFGLMRCREFIMKDAYSFHATQEDLIREFHVMEETYKKIYTRLGLDFRVVEADSGAIGGSGSKEFMLLANSGEDTIVVCPACTYGANIEAARRKALKKNKLDTLDIEKIHTPNLQTIQEVCSFLKVDPYYSIKAVIKKAIYENESKIVVFFIRGTDTLEDTKACNSINALEVLPANEDELKSANLLAGYCGIVNFPKDIRVVFDEELKGENNILCGANEEHYHLKNVDLTSLDLEFADLHLVNEGDLCPKCSQTLIYKKGIEAGHIFQLGKKYSSAMNATFLDQNGKPQAFFMGCYGIGVSRLVAAVIEQHHDEKGCLWTKETTPFMIDIIVSNAKKEDELNIGLDIYGRIKAIGIETIIDDRVKERFGFKMNDFELMGFPYAIIVGKRCKDGYVELVNRKTSKKIEIEITNLEEEIKKL